jgi:hypothetical protein
VAEQLVMEKSPTDRRRADAPAPLALMIDLEVVPR